MSMATTDTEKAEATLATLIARAEIESAQANFLHGLDDRDDSAKAMGQFKQTTHLTGLAIIDVVDDEHATGVSRGIGRFAIEGGSFAVKAVRISDRFSRRDSRWKLAHRNVRMIAQFSVDTVDDIRRLDPASATA